jgi:uncharacterized repeat protein (TIGR02543 family)
MKTVFSLWKRHYVRTFSVLLVAVFLLAGVVSCNGEPADEYVLTMAVSPAGGGVATDETGTPPYAEGTVVSIKAVPAAGYQFVDWTDTGVAFDNPSAEETTFAMPARDVTVTANFELAPLDHFKCYWVDPLGGPPEEIVSLEDQFVEDLVAEVRYADLFCNPAEKMHGSVTTPISNDEGHLAIYQLEYEEEPVTKRVEVTNQFGTQNLTVYGPVELAVPTQKVEAGGGLPCVDFEDLTVDTVYVVTDTFSDSGATMTVKEFQWGGGTWTSDGTAMVDDELKAGGSGLDINCNNVNINFDFGGSLNGLSLLYGEYGGNLNIDINGTFQNFNDFADIDGLTIGGVDVAVTDLGGGLGKLELDGVINSFDLGGQELWVDDVCPAVPYEPPLLDHYLLYEVIESTPMDPVLVVLNDQFEGEPDAFLVAPRFLANPVRKTHDDEVTDILDPDTHLVFYDIEVSGGNELSPTVDVEAKNQFGDQEFVAFEAAYLAVPSEKTVLPPPALNHFRSYWVDPLAGIVDTPVLLEDQFHAGEPISAMVMYDWFFCNPVEKWLDEERWSPIWHPDDHLYIYGIEYAAPEYWQVEVSNQFGGNQLLTVFGPVALVVPTQKEGHEPPVDLDHYLLYQVVPPYPEVLKPVYLVDQFIAGQEATVTVPIYFANPVIKTHGPDVTPIQHPNAHLVFYGLDISGSFSTGDWITATNQFGAQEIVAFYPGEGPTVLGVPSAKLWWETYEPLP